MKPGTLRTLNRRLLSSQLLIKKARGKSSLISITEACSGINSQNFRDSFLSFWARAGSFSDKALLSGFKPKGDLSRTWTVRGTVHTFPSKDYYTHVFGSPRDRILASHDRYARQLGLPERQRRIELLYEPLLDEIKEEMVTKDFIGKFMAEKLGRLGLKGYMKLDRGWTSEATHGPTWTGIAEMSYLGLLSNAGRIGSGNRWMSTAHWLKSGTKVPDVDDCALKLVSSYIENYGPVSFSDIVYWTGHRKGDMSRIINSIRGNLVVDKFDNSDEEYFSLGNQYEGATPPPKVIILPRFDSLMMGHSDKSRFMSPERRNKVFISAGIINPTILLNGFVAGTWRKEGRKRGLGIHAAIFEEIGPSDRMAIEEKFSEYGDYLKSDVSVTFHQSS